MQTYIIKGEPMAWQRARLCGRSFYEGQKKQRAHNRIFLENQHDDKPLYNGPIKLDIKFFFPLDKDPYKKPFCDLIKYVDEVAVGVIYKKNSIICCVTSERLFDENPRTELAIEVLKREKTKNKKKY